MTRLRIPFLVGAVMTIVVSSGCADSSTPAPAPSPTEATVAPSSPSSPSSSTPPTGAAALAVADLAGTLGVDETTIEVLSMEEVTWRDGSRGCAVPGDSYTQALISGSRITLRVDGADYEYHAGGSRPPSLCENPTE